MIKVCFINPPQYLRFGFSKEVSFPIGIGYLASYLKLYGVEVKILDAVVEGYDNIAQDGEFTRYGLSYDDIISRLIEFQPDFVAISCMFTSQSDIMHTLTKEIKKNMDIKIIVGGAHVSSCPSVSKDSNIDYTVVGEGEREVLKIVTGIDMPVDIKDLPMPAYELYNMEEYLKISNSRSHVKKRCMSIITSRGCPYKCTFCSNHVVTGRKWRSRAPTQVIDEIRYLRDNYNIEHIFFEDDNITLDNENAKQIFLGIKELGLSWETPNGVRVDTLTPDLLDVMKDTGCVRIVLAIESGNQYFLNKVIKKNLDLQKVEKVIKEIKKRNIDMCAFFILGIPGETELTINDTINFAYKIAKESGVRPYFTFAIPIPSTEMWDIAVKNKYIKKNFVVKDYLRMIPIMNIGTLSPEELINIRKNAIRKIGLSLLLHHPKSILQSETFLRLKEIIL